MTLTLRTLLMAVMCCALSAVALGQDAPAHWLTYEAVSIHAHDPNDGNMSISNQNGRYVGRNVGLQSLIFSAFGLTNLTQVEGLPHAIEQAGFDIDAKMDAEEIAAFNAMPKAERDLQRQHMLRAMLEERFHLATHRETRQTPVYNLVVAKGGFKLKPADANGPPLAGFTVVEGQKRSGRMMFSNGQINAQGFTLTQLAANLQSEARRTVIDKTGIAGEYDIHLTWTPDNVSAAADAPAGPTIFEAVEEQLGLKLEPAKGPVDYVVVDHVEQPTPN